MTARLEKNGTYTSQFWYEDIYGKRRHKCKRGFATEEEADAFEEGFLRRARVRRASSRKVGGDGICYTVRIGSNVTYLFYEDPRWFVEEVVKDGMSA